MAFPAGNRGCSTRRGLNMAIRNLVAEMTYEVVPVKNLAVQVPQIPAGSRVSVTCSPNKTIGHSLDVAESLAVRGHCPIPHIAARMVADHAHLRRVANRLTAIGIDEVFVIAGDSPEPGAYPDAMALLRDLLDIGVGQIRHVGVGCYPDGHAFISDVDLHASLHEKQALFTDAGIDGHVSTQMCFSAPTISSWLRQERDAGFELPVHLGVPEVVDRSKLMAMGMRLGVGTSLRYLKKNRTGVVKLLASSSFNPSRLLDPLADEFADLRIDGLHVFTFNQIAPTVAWQKSIIG